MNEAVRDIVAGKVAISDMEIEYIDRGRGAPILYLHGGAGLAGDKAFIELLADKRRVVAPSHPGFGASSLPDWLDSVDDIAHVHLELMDRLGIARADIVGMSLGGWIAAEMATKTPERFPRMALIGPVGVKTGPADRLDIPDIFAMPAAELDRLRFHDPDRHRPDIAAMSDDALTVMARNHETLALVAWEPYMHNPKLRHRLHRARIPVLLMRGESDGIVSADYLTRYARLFADARIATIPAAGHGPQVEQPDEAARTILEFLEQGTMMMD